MASRSVVQFVLLVVATLGFASMSEAKIARVWRGKVANTKAQEYEKYIGEGINGFSKIKGNQGYTLFTDKRADVTHFMVISYWDAKSSIIAYAGKDIEKTRFLPRDKEFLIEPEETVTNYEILETVGASK